MTIIRSLAALIALACCIPAPVSAQMAAPTYKSGNTPLTATGTFLVGSVPTAYAGAPIDMTSYASVTISCSSAPSAGTIQGAADGVNYITQSAVMNSASGFSITTATTAAGTYTLSGHQYIQVSGMAGGTCFIAGGQ